jgi:hypothetical protein
MKVRLIHQHPLEQQLDIQKKKKKLSMIVLPTLVLVRRKVNI